MYIARIKIRNYKSFLDSEEITFEPGFNIVVGQNSVGKTALLEALSLKFSSKPHRSLKTMPRTGITPKSLSDADVDIIVSGQEVYDQMVLPGQPFHLMRPDLNESHPQSLAFLEEFKQCQKIRYTLRFSPNGFTARAWPSHDFFSLPPGANSARRYLSNHDGEVEITGNMSASAGSDEDAVFKVTRGIYAFRAERLNVGEGNFGPSVELATDASNLPEVLGSLQGRNKPRFDRFNSLVSRIFPAVRLIGVRPKQGTTNRLEIVLWNEDPGLEREDFAIPLQECGTGIGQVLAILYVCLTSEVARVILIDEPNSFLHPAAAKKLIEVLTEFPQHQYIISTHSPEIIRAARPATVILLQWRHPETMMTQISAHDLEGIQTCLREIGTKLSDVFGADRILWVEGPTEEIVLKEVLDKLLPKRTEAINVVAVKNTGDFQGKRRQQILLVMDIYKKLSSAGTLIPRAYGFLFDRELLTAAEMDDIRRLQGGLVKLLPRRMLENYLLDAEAITAVLNDLPTFTKGPLPPEQIEKYLSKNLIRFLPELENASDEPPEVLVDGANLLKALFSDLSNAQEDFSKTIHSAAIARWLIDNHPERIQPLTDFLHAVIAD